MVCACSPSCAGPSPTIIPSSPVQSTPKPSCPLYLLALDPESLGNHEPEVLGHCVGLFHTLSPGQSFFCEKTWFCSSMRFFLLDYRWGYKLVQPLWKTVWSFLKKLKIELPCDLVIPLLGVFFFFFLEKTLTQKMQALECSLQRSLKQPRHGRKLNVHQQMNG